MVKCPVCGMMVNENTAPSLEYKGETYYFMKPAHKEMFEKDPEKFLRRASERTNQMSNMDM
jgi:YHS domain-containing protein